MNLFFAQGSFFPAQTGGADNSAYWLARALGRQGHRVSVATTNSGLTAGQVPFDRWTITDFGEIIYVKTRIHYLPLRLFYYAVRRAMRADVVHLNALFYPISLLLALVCVPLGKRVVWSVHGELAPEALKISAARKRLYLRLIGLFAPRVTFHVTSNTEQAYALDTFGPATRTVVVPLYMELPVCRPHQPAEPYLLFLGRLHPIKALDRLLDALSQTPAFRQSPWRLKIIGIGEPAYEQALKDQVVRLGLADQVDFLGFRDGAAKYELLANAYLTLLPSHTENFSIIVVESLSQATPVLTSVYTPWQLLPDQQAGWWVDNEPAILAQTLNTALTLPDETFRQYRRNALHLAVNGFDIDRHIGYWETIYGQVAKPVAA